MAVQKNPMRLVAYGVVLVVALSGGCSDSPTSWGQGASEPEEIVQGVEKALREDTIEPIGELTYGAARKSWLDSVFSSGKTFEHVRGLLTVQDPHVEYVEFSEQRKSSRNPFGYRRIRDSGKLKGRVRRDMPMGPYIGKLLLYGKTPEGIKMKLDPGLGVIRERDGYYLKASLPLVTQDAVRALREGRPQKYEPMPDKALNRPALELPARDTVGQSSMPNLGPIQDEQNGRAKRARKDG
jgi:hypothetical protein